MRSHEDAEEDCSPEIVPAIIPRAPWRVTSVRHLPGFKLSVRFNDGTEGTVSMYGLIHSPHAGVFSALQDAELFAKVGLNYGAVTWPGELDLAPDSMHEAIRKNGEWVLSAGMNGLWGTIEEAKP